MSFASCGILPILSFRRDSRDDSRGRGGMGSLEDFRGIELSNDGALGKAVSIGVAGIELEPVRGRDPALRVVQYPR
jgi:hypothetical protein